jgi:uncharacterized protein (PEP-CTERM system associated)
MAMATDGHRSATSCFAAALIAIGVAGATSATAADIAATGAGTTAVTGTSAPDAGTAGAAMASANRWRFVPNINLRETATDNVDQSSDANRKGDFITEIIPGLSIEGNGARVKAHLNYRMDSLIYARDSSKNNLQNYLDAGGTVEAIENFLFVDGTASITQDAVSAFGPRPTDATSTTNNRTETRAFQLSPYIRGRLGATSTDYEARYSYSVLQSSESTASNSRVGEFTASLKGLTRWTDVGWQLLGDSQSVDNDVQRDTQAARARGVLTYTIDPQFQLSATGGYERNDYVTLDTVDKVTYGAGFQWAPTPRTSVHGTWERRFFGDGWDYGASHRTPFFSFDLSDRRDVNTDAQSRTSAGSGAAYDLLFAALTTRIPNPIDRAAEALRILHGGGIPPGLGLPPDFLVGTAFVERRQQASAAFLGVRNTFTFIVYQVHRDALGAGAEGNVPSDQTDNIKERGGSAAYSHRLSGMSSVSAMVSLIRTTSDTSNLASRQWDGRVSYVTQLGPRTSGSLEYRYVRFDGEGSGTSDYRENAVVASVLLQF